MYLAPAFAARHTATVVWTVLQAGLAVYCYSRLSTGPRIPKDYYPLR